MSAAPWSKSAHTASTARAGIADQVDKQPVLLSATRSWRRHGRNTLSAVRKAGSCPLAR